MSRLRDGVAAGAVAAVLSGIPSTVHALLTRRDLLESTRAAGTLLLPERAPPAALVAAGVIAHIGISLTWGAVLALLLPRPPTPVHGAAAGVCIAALDLGVVARAFPRVAALPAGPQVADHLAYGLVVAAVLRARSR